MGSTPITSTMIESYLNNKGKLTIISDMPDAYLLNSYSYYKKRMELMKMESFMSQYDLEINDIVNSLKLEIEKRKLI